MSVGQLMFDVAIVGGGITGSALFYMLGKYSDVKKVILFEKNVIGSVNSHERNNSQTLHFGDIETNFSYEKAVKLRDAAEMVVAYLQNHDGLSRKTKKMVIGVGDDEIRMLKHRYNHFKKIFPQLKKLSKDEIALIEPAVVEGRRENIIALCSDDGYAVNFRKLAQSFIDESTSARMVVSLTSVVRHIKKTDEGYLLDNTAARSVVVSAGAHTLSFAHQLGYALDYILFPVAGGYYGARQVLRNKIYTLQDEHFPFAALHGDPDVDDGSFTRFGPTAKPIPLLERHVYASLKPFLGISLSRKAVFSMFSFFRHKRLITFLLKNISFSIPFFGKYLFARNARKIVPLLKTTQLIPLRDGGIRPQVFDTEKKQLLMGDVKVYGEHVIFNVTPSPAASVCLKNALDDMRRLAAQLGFHVDEEKIRNDFGGLSADE